MVYALATPMMVSNFLGAKPRPLLTPPIAGLEDVTNGYVPKSKSSMVAFAPSTKIFFPFLCASLTYSTVSAMNGSMRDAISLYRTISASTSYSKPSNRAAASAASVRKAFANLSASRISPKRTPLRVALEAYAGPMPRFVVPILFPLNSASRKPSISL